MGPLDSFPVSISRVAATCGYQAPRHGGIHDPPGAETKIVGILGYDSDDDLALLEDGSHHRQLFFILIDRDRFRVDAAGMVVHSGLVFREGEMFFAEFPAGLRIDYLVNYNEEPLRGRALTIPVTVQGWAQGYTFCKDLTSDLLRHAGIPVPRGLSVVLTRTLADGTEVLLNRGGNPRMDARRAAADNVMMLNWERLVSSTPRGLLAAFLAAHGCDRGVLKPNRGGCGADVHFFDARNLDEMEAVLSALFQGGSDVVIQERIKPPLVMTAVGRQDWNLRVFATRDHRGRAIVPDMVVRIGPEGGPINFSLSAEALLLEEIAELLGWDGPTLRQVREQVAAVSARAYQTMCAAIAEDAPPEAGPSAPDIMGIDVIVRRQGTGWQACVIEMDIHPGGAWDLNNRLRTVSRAASGRGGLSRQALDARLGGVNRAWIRLIGDRCHGTAGRSGHEIATAGAP